MFEFLGNNLLLLFSTYVVAIIAWFLCARIESWRVRRGLRVSIIFLSVPIIYFGHPFVYFPLWVLLVMFIEQFSLGSIVMLFIALIILRGLIWLSYQKKNNQK